MDPLTISAAVSAGTSILGGLFGRKSQKKMQEREYQAQKEFAQHGVRWRVEDAKAAGLHPLYALGAQLPSFSPSFASGEDPLASSIADAGQHVGRAIAAQQTAQEREAAQLQLEILKKNLEESDARILLLQSEAARNVQGWNEAGAFPTDNFGVMPEGQAPQINRGMVEQIPSQVATSSANDISVGAGELYAWRKYNVAPDLQMLLPGGAQGNIEEALESVSESVPLMVAVIAENIARNPQFTEDVVGHYLGAEGRKIYKIIRSLPLPTPGRISDSIRSLRDAWRGPPPRGPVSGVIQR